MNESDPEKKLEQVLKAFDELHEIAVSIICERFDQLRCLSKEERRKSMESMETRTLELTLDAALDFEEYEVCEMAKELLEERKAESIDAA